jgi:hypothetical protein
MLNCPTLHTYTHYRVNQTLSYHTVNCLSNSVSNEHLSVRSVTCVHMPTYRSATTLHLQLPWMSVPNVVSHDKQASLHDMVSPSLTVTHSQSHQHLTMSPIPSMSNTSDPNHSHLRPSRNGAIHNMYQSHLTTENPYHRLNLLRPSVICLGLLAATIANMPTITTNIACNVLTSLSMTVSHAYYPYTAFISPCVYHQCN